MSRERRHPLVSAAFVCLALVLLATGCGRGNSATSGKNRRIYAGYNDPNDKTIALMSFFPSTATVEVGATVTWKFRGPEPHTVTFVPRGAKPPLPSDPDATATVAAAGSYNGTTKVSSGLLGTPKPGVFKLTFGKAGTYTYYCAIHPVMQGTLTVVAAGRAAETQKAISKRARAEAMRYLAEGRAAKTTYLATQAKQKRNADGSTTWTVLMGTSTAHTDILAFQPVPVNIRKGDKVVFVNYDTGVPHTASFGGDKVPKDPESDASMKATGTSPLTLNPTDFINSGWLPPNAPPGSGPPLAVRSFTFNVPAAGTYSFVCILHVLSGQTGTIVAT